jgi:hypothetical protein
MSLSCRERDVLLLVTAADAALDTLNTHIHVDRLVTDGNTAETADGVPVAYDFPAFARRTAQFVLTSLHIQNYSIIFVISSGALDSTETESVIHEADIHIYYLL